ncbi:MAG: hypothetical protein NWE94_09265 [Candidatus Bathyarchaeota archaeon]|nr:hypothetical protein [Candidatus Bathyarchaeota archaeon]
MGLRKHKTFTLTAFLAMLLTTAVAETRFTHAAEDSWTTKAPMQQARNCRVAVVNEKIYAIGGENLATTEEYDPATDTWTYKASMPTPRDSFGIAVFQNKIYCIGGRNSSGATNVNEVYDPETDTWETKKAMPTPRSGIQANIVNGKIYLIGGVADTQALTINEVYDPQSNSWTTKAPMSAINFTFLGASNYASTVFNNKIYIIGGWSVGGQWPVRGVTFNLTRIHNTENDSWSLGASSPAPAVYASAVATTGTFAPERIYVFGADAGYPFWMLGIRGFTAQSYDPKTDSWTTCTAVPTQRVDASVALLNDKLYVIGGRTIEQGSSSFVPSTSFSAANEQYTPFGYGTTPPTVKVVSPENMSSTLSSITLVFTVNKPVSWMGYSLDKQEITPITGNITIAGLSNGLHNITVYVKDAVGNSGVSETVQFTVNQPESFSALPQAIAAIIAIGVAAAGLLIYFKKRRR